MRPGIGSGPSRLEAAEISGLLLLLTAYAASFSLANHFDLLGIRVWPLFDDAMISMRFAKNLAAGYGLRFNPGQAPVEGFSNPLWTLAMALLIRLVGAGLESLLWVRALGAAAYGLGLALGWSFLRAVFPERPAARFAGVALYAVSLPGLYWAVYGMETSLEALLLMAAMLAAWQAQVSGRAGWWLPLLALLAPACRLDLAVPLLAVVAGAALGAPMTAKPMLGRVLLALALGLAVQTGLRLWYYGAWLPNTYYLKMTGLPVTLRLERGVRTLWDAFMRGWWVVAALAGWGLAGLDPARRRALAAPIVACTAVHVWVGGDAWETWGLNRFLVPMTLPLYFACLLGATDVAEKAVGPAKSALTGALLGALIVLSVAELDDAGTYGTALLQREAYLNWSNGKMAVLGMVADRISPLGATWASADIGNLGYFLDRPIVDLLGKCDPVVAHEAAQHWLETAPAWDYLPGHSKLDYAWSLGRLKPDLMFDNIPRLDLALPYLQAAYVRVEFKQLAFFCRRDQVSHLRLPPGSFKAGPVPAAAAGP